MLGSGNSFLVERGRIDRESVTRDPKIGDILKDPVAVKVLEKYAPGISRNPMIGLVKGMSLRFLLPLPQAKQAGITEEMVNRVLVEINALET